MKIEWKENPFPNSDFLYRGNLWVEGERFANISVVYLLNHKYQVNLTFAKAIFGNSTIVENGADFFYEEYRTRYVMENVTQKLNQDSHSLFYYQCSALYWLKRNGMLDKQFEPFSPQEKIKLLIPLLELDEIPDLMVMLDRALEQREEGL